MSAGDPYSDLVLPRICGGVIGVVCLIVAGTAAAVLVAALSATYLYNADGRAFLDASLIDRGDLTAFFVKAFGYGLGIPLAASASGLAARGGSGAVGAATTSGVVTACVSVLAIDLAVSGVLFWAGL
jgi:phospholipid/cholesterol/gamma-HCH transport system permease protein